MKVKKIVAGLTAASCLSGVITVLPDVVSRTYAAEIVHNDFERNYEVWYGEGDNVEVTAQLGEGFGTSRGMKVTGRNSASQGAASSKGLYLFGGDKYTYSVKVYSETAEKFNFSLLVIDEKTGRETTVKLDSKNAAAGEWTELSGSYTAPKDSYEFKLSITNDSTNDFLFDEFLITGDKEAQEAHAVPSGKGLKDEFASYFRVGNIFNRGTISNSGIQGIILKDHNAVECENETKPDATLVQNGSSDTNIKVSLSSCAAICDFCVKNNIAFRVHTVKYFKKRRHTDSAVESFSKQQIMFAILMEPSGRNNRLTDTNMKIPHRFLTAGRTDINHHAGDFRGTCSFFSCSSFTYSAPRPSWVISRA